MNYFLLFHNHLQEVHNQKEANDFIKNCLNPKTEKLTANSKLKLKELFNQPEVAAKDPNYETNRKLRLHTNFSIFYVAPATHKYLLDNRCERLRNQIKEDKKEQDEIIKTVMDFVQNKAYAAHIVQFHGHIKTGLSDLNDIPIVRHIAYDQYFTCTGRKMEDVLCEIKKIETNRVGKSFYASHNYKISPITEAEANEVLHNVQQYVVKNDLLYRKNSVFRLGIEINEEDDSVNSYYLVVAYYCEPLDLHTYSRWLDRRETGSVIRIDTPDFMDMIKRLQNDCIISE